MFGLETIKDITVRSLVGVRRSSLFLGPVEIHFIFLNY